MSMKGTITTAVATLAVAVISQQTDVVTDFFTLVLGGLLTRENAQLIAKLTLPALIVVGVVLLSRRTGHRVQRGRWSESGDGPVEVLKVSREDLDFAVQKSVKSTVNGDIKRVTALAEQNAKAVESLTQGQERIHMRVDDILTILATKGTGG